MVAAANGAARYLIAFMAKSIALRQGDVATADVHLDFRLAAIGAASRGRRSPPSRQEVMTLCKSMSFQTRQSTGPMVAPQIGTSTLSECDVKPFGGVTTNAPQRGHAFPVAVSMA
jgi:hypothetical protein